MKILSKQESFRILRSKFERLKPFDVIELCDKGRAFRAVVSRKTSDGFFVVELTDSILRRLVDGVVCGDPPEEIEVVVPDDPGVEHPMWNTLRRA